MTSSAMVTSADLGVAASSAMVVSADLGVAAFSASSGMSLSCLSSSSTVAGIHEGDLSSAEALVWVIAASTSTGGSCSSLAGSASYSERGTTAGVSESSSTSVEDC